MTDVTHLDIMVSLARLEEKIDHILKRANQTEKTLDKHDSRIESLERSRAWTAGALAALAAVFGIVEAIFNIRN